MFGAGGVVQVWAGAGFVRWGLEARLQARSGEPGHGSFFRVAHFGTSPAGERFMAMAVTGGGGNILQPGGHIGKRSG